MILKRDRCVNIGLGKVKLGKVKRRLYTWTSPDGQHQNQIDYILCSQRWRGSIQSAKTRPGADCGSDHELLITKSELIEESRGNRMTLIKPLMIIQWK